MTHKHTPGPWRHEIVKTQVGICHKIGPLGSSTKLHDACLYDDCYSNVPRDMQLAADACLIAQAPAMLEALEQCLPYIHGATTDHSLYYQIVAVIKAAKGL